MENEEVDKPQKHIEVVTLKPVNINTNFGNPRKINKKQREELQRSLETFGDFGSFIIDENNSVIGGNQRLSILKDIAPEREILCKRLIGYTEAEKRAINIKSKYSFRRLGYGFACRMDSRFKR